MVSRPLLSKAGVCVQDFGIFEFRCIWQLFKEVFQIPFEIRVVGVGSFDQAVYNGTIFSACRFQ